MDELEEHHAIRKNNNNITNLCLETEDKNGYPLNMFISPMYTLSDSLQVGVKLWL